MSQRRRQKKMDYEPIVRQNPEPFPETLVSAGRLELAALRENDALWQAIAVATTAAINEQARLEDVQALTLESRIALRLMQADLDTLRQPYLAEHSVFLSFRWAVAMAWVLTELLPQSGLAEEFLTALQAAEFRTRVADTYEQWYLPNDIR